MSLKQLTIGLLNYQEAYGSLPPAYTVDEKGNRLHSWRVLILPYIGLEDLYKKIRLNEPWDSPWNWQFRTEALLPILRHQKAVGTYETFLCYNVPRHWKGRGLGSYAVVVDEKSMFPSKNSVSLKNCPDKAETVLVVEMKTPFCWMDPYADPNLETACQGINSNDKGVGSVHPDGANVAMKDGSILFIENTITSLKWKEFLIRVDR